MPANVGGIPKIISVPATGLNLQSRTFWGAGAPSANTLQAGPQVIHPMYLTGSATSAPDLYFDMTGFALWICTANGTNATSVWKQISGNNVTGINFSIYNSGSIYSPGAFVRVPMTAVVNGISLTPGHYICAVTVTGSANQNMIPQYPEPATGTVYWYWVGFLGQPASECIGGNVTVYIQQSVLFT